MFFSNSEIAQMKQAGGARGATDDDDFQVVPIEKISQLRIVFNILCIVQQFTVNLNDCLFVFADKRARVLNAEGLALGAQIATSKKRERDLIDGSFHRSDRVYDFTALFVRF